VTFADMIYFVLPSAMVEKRSAKFGGHILQIVILLSVKINLLAVYCIIFISNK